MMICPPNIQCSSSTKLEIEASLELKIEDILKSHFVLQPFLSNRKGSHDPELTLPGIANP